MSGRPTLRRERLEWKLSQGREVRQDRGAIAQPPKKVSEMMQRDPVMGRQMTAAKRAGVFQGVVGERWRGVP